MKKIKLMLVAFMAMVGVNAFAAGGNWANTTFTYTYTADDGTGTATITGFVQDYDELEMATVTIPAEVKCQNGKVAKVTKVGTKAFENNTNIKKVIFASENLVEIETLAFSGCTALKDVDFSAATGLTTIGTGAFTKAIIQSLDFSTTKLGTVENLFGTDFDNADETKRVTNATLTTLKLSAYWTVIKEEAFAGCTALATVDFGTVATGTGAPATQAFEATKDYMFAGCPITALNFTGTLVQTLPAHLLLDGAIYTKNESLTSVTLTKDFTALNAALSNCENLATVTGYIATVAGAKVSGLVTLVNNEFLNDAALTSFDLTKVTTLGDYAFSGTGLTSVIFPKNQIATIPEGCFMDCSDLATVTWDDEEASGSGGLALIEKLAFANTGLTSITIPVGALSDADDKVEENAFAFCPSLESFVWKWAGTTTKVPVNVNAFKGLSKDQVTFFTTAANQAAWTLPTNCKWGDPDAAPGTDLAKLTMTAYKNGSAKYYYKMKATANIAIAKTAAKVYSAYADFTTDDGCLNILSYKSANGYYQIKAGDVCIIISETETVETSTAEATGVSGDKSAAYSTGNALFIQAADVSRTTLMTDNTLNPNGAALYGWVNSTKGTGFQKIATGKTIGKGALLAFANEPAAGGRLTIKWYDEDGNLEAETTAIQGVEIEAGEADAKYNLAGQKVNASYKGLVIKDGKKYMQK